MGIKELLRENENKDLLRFLTCGSVDDGKSTMIGRLLHDSKRSTRITYDSREGFQAGRVGGRSHRL